MNVKIDDRQLKQFQRMCKSGPKEFQYVTAEYLNSSAFRARELNMKNLQSQMTIRDQRVLSSSLRVEKTKPVSIKQVKVIYGENQMKLVTEEITKIGARSDVLQNKVPAGNGSDPSPACGQSIFS